MRKLYENFHIFHFQKRIVSAETIRGNMVFIVQQLKMYTTSGKKSKHLGTVFPGNYFFLKVENVEIFI